MFKTIFTKLCNEKGESPTSVCLKVGLSNSAYTAWDDQSVPRLATLLKIADYFGVSTDYLLGREQAESPFAVAGKRDAASYHTMFAPLTDREIRLMMAYRERTEVRHAVDKLLDIPADDRSVPVYRAAESEDRRPDEVVLDRAEKIEKMKQTTESGDSLL